MIGENGDLVSPPACDYFCSLLVYSAASRAQLIPAKDLSMNITITGRNYGQYNVKGRCLEAR